MPGAERFSRRKFLEMVLEVGGTALFLGCTPPLEAPSPEPTPPSSPPPPHNPLPTLIPTPKETPTLIPVTKPQSLAPELSPKSPTPPKSLTSPKPESTPEPPKDTAPQEQRWTKEVWAEEGYGPNYLFDNWNVYYFTSRNQMQVVNLKTGELVWPWQETDISKFIFYTDPFDPLIYIHNPAYEFLGGQKLFAHNTQDRSIPWSQNINTFKPQGKQTNIQFTVTDAGLNFLFGVQNSTDNYSALIDKKSARDLWRGEGRIWYTNGKLGVVIVQSKADKAWKAIDIKTGKSTTLSRDVPNEYTVDTTSVDETTFFATISETKQVIENFRGEKVMFTRSEKLVLAIDIKSGKEVWRIPDEKLQGFKSIARFKGQSPDRLYLLFTPMSPPPAGGFLTPLTQLVAVDKKSGYVSWRTNIDRMTERDIYGETDNFIVLPDYENKGIVIIDALTGNPVKKRNFQIDKFLGTFGDFVVVSKGEKDGGIYALNKKSGDVVWEIKSSDYPFAGPGPLITEDKIVFVNLKSKTVNVFDISGKPVKEIKVPGEPQDIKIPLPGYVLVQSMDNRKPQLTLVKI